MLGKKVAFVLDKSIEHAESPNFLGAVTENFVEFLIGVADPFVLDNSDADQRLIRQAAKLLFRFAQGAIDFLVLAHSPFQFCSTAPNLILQHDRGLEQTKI